MTTTEPPGPALACPGCGSPDVDLRRGLLCGTCAGAVPVSSQPEAITEEGPMTTETTERDRTGVAVVGRCIREARTTAEMTQDDLAGALGVTQTCVSYWEAGKRDLGVTDLLRVAAAINVPVVSLLGAEYGTPASAPAAVTDYGPVRLELMGHRYREGRLSEVVIAGQPFLRLEYGCGSLEYYRPDAVYCITPGVSPPVPLAAIPERFNDALSDDYGDDEDPF
jgi:transcriptional regulator with XRE-family HTH domain